MNEFEKRYPLRFAYATDIIEKLKTLPRTGWLQWDISESEAETVYDHIREVRMYAYEYKEKLSLSDSGLVELLDMLEIHDWPEALVGDGVILGDEEDVDKLRADKVVKEMEAMQTICESIKDGEYILSLYQRYSGQSDKIAQLAKQIEKLQAVFKAGEYEKKYQKKGLLKEFVHYTKDLIHDPFLQTEMKRVSSVLLTITLVISTDSSVLVGVLLFIK